MLYKAKNSRKEKYIIYMESEILSKLYKKYNIKELTYGRTGDKLGDVMEDYVVDVLNEKELLHAYLSGAPMSNYDQKSFKLIINKISDNSKSIKMIKATRKVPSKDNGGMPKTDVIATITYTDNSVNVCPISVKQTKARKVAVAEYSVESILEGARINDDVVRTLMYKFQRDASAKHFTKQEKIQLTEALAPYRHQFVRWVLSGSAEETTDVRCPKYYIEFPMDSSHNASLLHIKTIEEKVNGTIYDKNGKVKAAGFGTGLSWTYATGSKYSKIQYKA